METKLLLKRIVNGRKAGVTVSTSDNVVKKIIAKINFDKAGIIVEYGSGNGMITKMLLKNMKPNSILFVFETNKSFIDELLQINDKRLIIINGNAEHANIILKNRYKIESVDYVVSITPFMFLERRKRKRIIYKIYSLLNKKGRFISYQYSWLIFNLMSRKFQKVNWKLTLLNLVPVVIIEGIK